MKNLLRKYRVAFIVSMVFSLFAGKVTAQLQTVKKEITRSYSDLKNEQLTIANQYGDVVVKTWHRKKIVIDIEISAQAKTMNTASQLVKRVNIETSRTAGEINCKSVIGNYLILSAPVQIRAKNADTQINMQGKAITIEALPKQHCTIRYQIYVPADLTLKISNQFGNIQMSDYAGRLDIDEKFGDFTAGILNGLVNFNIEQGNMNIAHISSGHLSGKGFDKIGILQMTGKVNSKFSSGNQLAIGLKDGIDSVNIGADNVHQVNISGIKVAQASYLVQAVVSKVFFNDLTFNDQAPKFKEFNIDAHKMQLQRQSDSVTSRPDFKASIKNRDKKDTLELKKKMDVILISKLKKVHEYKAGPDTAKAKIILKVSFSTLNLRD